MATPYKTPHFERDRQQSYAVTALAPAGTVWVRRCRSAGSRTQTPNSATRLGRACRIRVRTLERSRALISASTRVRRNSSSMAAPLAPVLAGVDQSRRERLPDPPAPASRTPSSRWDRSCPGRSPGALLRRRRHTLSPAPRAPRTAAGGHRHLSISHAQPARSRPRPHMCRRGASVRNGLGAIRLAGSEARGRSAEAAAIGSTAPYRTCSKPTQEPIGPQYDAVQRVAWPVNYRSMIGSATGFTVVNPFQLARDSCL